MTIETNLSVSPYFDDYEESQKYNRILFKPATAVQVRELNQLQTILQDQVTRFGDHILQRGTLLDGCQASFKTAIPYVKIKDLTSDGRLPLLKQYIGLFAKNSSNLVSRVIETVDGFEAQDPDLKTLYVEYLNSGDSDDEAEYTRGTNLTIFNKNQRLYRIRVVEPSSGFKNSDKLVIVPALEVQNTTGGTTFSTPFQEDEIITGTTSGASAQILSVNATANSSALVLSIKPLTSDLAVSNTAGFNFAIDEEFEGDTSGTIARITGFAGRNAGGRLELTATSRAIDNVVLTRGGVGYYVPPHVTVSSTDASSVTNINEVDLQGENFISTVQIATDDAGVAGAIGSNPVGVGYGMSVSSGYIYQKGHFLEVDPQSIIVDKYANTPSDIAVGFETQERIVNSALDSTLLDNSAGFFNQNAPGADRLQLIPRLAVRTFAEAEEDREFFPIFRFSEGRVFSQSGFAVYNKLGEEIAKQTYEKSGNFVLDQFNITTRSTPDFADSSESFSYVIDPGHAYINGYRVKTERNYAKKVPKGTDTVTNEDSALDLIYGNYIRVNQLAGLFNFKVAAQVGLQDTGAEYYDSLGNITEPGSEIGTARIRSVVLERGVGGSANAIYRVYLFDIKMNSGKNFKNIKSIYTTDGVCDVITTPDPRNPSDNIAVLQETNRHSLLFNTRLPAKSVSIKTFNFRSEKTGTVATTGQVQLTAPTNSDWPYSGALSFTERRDLIITPEENLISDTNLGTANVSGNTVTGSSTSFLTDFVVGDYFISDSNIRQITSIANNTSMSFRGSSLTLTGQDITRVYPKNIPLPMSSRDGITASVASSILTIDIGFTTTASQDINAVVTLQRSNQGPVSKTARRNAFIKISVPSGNVKGPWCLGFPDVFRLRKVYAGTTTAALDVTNEFYVDHNQTENFHDLSYLYKKPTSTYVVSDGDDLLVEFDFFEHSNPGGVKTVSSFTINDAKILSELGQDIHTLEIPEVLRQNGSIVDLREAIDFRPVVANTVNYETDPASAPVNPANTVSFAGDNLFFPVPESDVEYDIEHYVGRTDTITLNTDGFFEFIIGRRPRSVEKNQMFLYEATVPPYPTLPENLSAPIEEILDTKVANESFSRKRRNKFTIQTEQLDRQVRGFTMAQIAQLERRIEILEYYSNLTLLDDEVRDLRIPSSIDSTLDRFKFGFFVDNFADSHFADIENPEYNASIFGFILHPAKLPLNIPLQVSDNVRGIIGRESLHFPSQSVSFLRQNLATTTPVIAEIDEDEEEPTPQINTTCQFIYNTGITGGADATSRWETSVFTLSSNTESSGLPIRIRFNNDPSWSSSGVGGGGFYYEIRQSDSPESEGALIFSSKSLNDVESLIDSSGQPTDSAIALANKGYRRGNGSRGNYLGFAIPGVTERSPGFSLRKLETANKRSGLGSGEFSVSYNPLAGRYIRVRAVTDVGIGQGGSASDPLNRFNMHFYNYEICYPADAFIDPINIEREPDPPLPAAAIQDEPIPTPLPPQQETRTGCEIAFDTFSATGDWEQAAAAGGVRIKEIPEGSGVCVLQRGAGLCRPVNDPNFPDHPASQAYTFPCPFAVSTRPTEPEPVVTPGDQVYGPGFGVITIPVSVTPITIDDPGTDKPPPDEESVSEIPPVYTVPENPLTLPDTLGFGNDIRDRMFDTSTLNTRIR